jgi:hypothetical integral membrane protein (TIGR02206 family)
MIPLLRRLRAGGVPKGAAFHRAERRYNLQQPSVMIAGVGAFDRFGPDHWMVMVSTTAAAVVAIRAARNGRSVLVRIVLCITLVATMVAFLVIEGQRGTLTPTDFLPLHLSDFAVFLAIFSLVTLRQRAAELLYFLSFAEALAIVTPDVHHALPHLRTIVFFVLHGATLVAGMFLTFGERLMPEKGAVIRTLLFLNLYAAFAAVVNALLGTNFLYLRRKPAHASPLDWMGSWPWYLVVTEAVAVVLFLLADLPFRWKRRNVRMGDGHLDAGAGAPRDS